MASPRYPNRWKHVNAVRLAVLTLAFVPLVLLPFATLYQHYLTAHAYDMLSPGEKRIYDVMDWLTGWLVTDPRQFDLLKGTTWSATLFGTKVSDPLAAVGQVAAHLRLYWPLLAAALVPALLTLVFGRAFCGWICPASLLYELADKLGEVFRAADLPLGVQRFDRRLKYLVLAVGLAASAATGSVLVSMIYPPAVVGRELYYYIAESSVGAGSAFFAVTVLFDLLVARRGFCRVLCPGGALYSALGRWRLLRVRRKVELCNDCGKCDKVCMFALAPMADGFGQECNNCAECMAVCPTGSLTFALAARDGAPQGPGHLGAAYRRANREAGHG